MALRRLVLLLAFTLVAGACSGGVEINVPPLPEAQRPLPLGAQPIVQVVRRARPAVVSVTTNLFAPGGQQARGTGTGFIVRADGIIVTNFHVVEDASRIQVLTADGDRFTARAIGADQNADLAVLKVDAEDLPTIPLGTSDGLELGQTVVALGFALALEGGPSVTSGIVSATERTIEAQASGGARTLEDLIQTDAAINPGNSGGPLLDLSGQVVGINTAAVQAGAAENIGFAVAMDRVRPTIDRSIEDPAQPTPFLGVSTRAVDELVVFELGLSVDHGALVVGVGGPAERAGIRVRDVIVAIGDSEVTTNNDVAEAILARKPGEEVDVDLVRGDDETTVTVSLGVHPLPVGA